MADNADIADHFVELNLAAAMDKASQAAQKLPVTGSCYNCGDASPEAPFCDRECASEWEWVRSRQNANK